MATRGRPAKRLPLTTLAGRMAAAADAVEMSSEEIAAALDATVPGITGAAVRKWLRAEREPRIETLKAYARVVGTSAGWLVEGGRNPEEDLQRFRELVLAGSSPADAWRQVTGRDDALSPTDADRLDRAVNDLRAAFERGGLAGWSQLSDRERAVVASMIDLLAERKEPDG